MPRPEPPPDERRVGPLLRWAATRLRAHATARLDAELLLAHVLDWPRTRLYAAGEERLAPALARRYVELVAVRAGGCPLAYLTGRTEFWSLPLAISPAVLVPRPETELVVEVTLAAAWPAHGGMVVDLGTGSGAIACALAHERPRACVVASDRSAAALRLARRNAADLGLNGVHVVQARWLCPFAAAAFDFVIANPPYIGTAEADLEPGLVYEPVAALFAGDDGLSDLTAIVGDARRCLRPGGLLVLEHGYRQGAAVRALCAQAGLRAIHTHRDLAGHERVTSARG